MKRFSFKKNIICEVLALACSGLSLFGWYTDNLACILIGIVAVTVLLILGNTPMLGDAIGFVVVLAIVASVGGWIFTLVSDRSFWFGAYSTLCFGLAGYTVVMLIFHCVAERNMRRAEREKAASRAAFDQEFGAAKEAPKPQEDERAEYSRLAYEYYKKARGIYLTGVYDGYTEKKQQKIAHLETAEKYARKALALGDKTIGLLIEDIEDYLIIIEDEY